MTKRPNPILLLAIFAAALAACESPGHLAMARGDATQLQQILDQPKHGNENIDSLLSGSIKYFDCLACDKILLEMGAKSNDWLLYWAAVRGKEKAASLLVDYGDEPRAAMSVVHSMTGGRGGLSDVQAQGAMELLQKLERDHASRAAAAPVAAKSAPSAAGEPLRLRAAPLFHDAERPDDYALIIGIEKYADLPAATYAERDASAAADFATAMGVPAHNISTLTGDRATRAGLVKKLEGWLANNVNDNSTVYFYYSGHGAPDTKTGQAYLVPFDGDPEYLDQTGYPLKRVYEKLGALKAKHVIVMLDSCFSGAGGRSVLAKGARPLVTNVGTGFNSADGKITVLAAAGADQISGTDDDKGHGLFSYYLFNGLNGGAKDASGQVTVKSLFDYLKPKVVDEAHRVNRDQVPQFQSADAASAGVVLRSK
jgi:hypothetical protein